MALHMYNVAHPLGGPNGIKGKSGVVAAWGIYKGTRAMIPACDGDGLVPQDWGCTKLMEDAGVRVIQAMALGAERDSTIAPASVDHPSVCERFL